MARQIAADQISFYDESLKKQIEGSYRTDGRSVHVRSVKYGIKSAPYGDLDTYPDQDGLNLLAQKLLSQLARDPGREFKDLQQQKGDPQLQPRESYSCSGMRG